MKDKKYYIKKVVRFLNESRIYLSPDEVILLIDIYKNNTEKRRPLLPYLVYKQFNIIY
jgi:hypothetical protein